MSNLQQRLIWGSITTLFAILMFWFSPDFPFFFTLVLAALITLAAREFYYLATSKGYHPLINIGLPGCFFYAFAIYASTRWPHADIWPYIILILTLFASFFSFFKKGHHPLMNISITLFALVYLAIPLATWVSIGYFFPKESAQEGRWWLFYLLAVTKVTDMGAYFVGKTFGKHKMAPYLSPGKSWEGAVGGLIAGVIASVIFYLIQSYIALQITLFQSLYLGLILSIMGQLGDLAESLLKRDAGVKNSSDIPGLGGILDMVDSLVFTSPILYIFLKTHYLYGSL